MSDEDSEEDSAFRSAMNNLDLGVDLAAAETAIAGAQTALKWRAKLDDLRATKEAEIQSIRNETQHLRIENQCIRDENGWFFHHNECLSWENQKLKEAANDDTRDRISNLGEIRSLKKEIFSLKAENISLRTENMSLHGRPQRFFRFDGQSNKDNSKFVNQTLINQCLKDNSKIVALEDKIDALETICEAKNKIEIELSDKKLMQWKPFAMLQLNLFLKRIVSLNFNYQTKLTQ